MDLKSLLTVLIIGSFVIITPGPNLAIVLKNSFSGNPKLGITTAAGLAFGNFIHITYCLIGIGFIISRSIVVFNLIKAIGALYLIYIGIKMLKTKNNMNENSNTKEHTLFTCFKHGFLTDLLNPKATLFFLSLFTQIIHPESTSLEKAAYGLTLVLIEFLYFTAISTIIGNKKIHSFISKFIHGIEKITGYVLIIFGLKMMMFNDSK
jgi:RhtB (resistance to homoserine/threonine) family protein